MQNLARPFPDLGTVYYNLVTRAPATTTRSDKLEQPLRHDLSFLATYTYAHSLDDTTTPLGSDGDGGYRNVNLIGPSADYSNSPWDVRHRFTLTALRLPFGNGRRFLNHGGVVNQLVGGWANTLVFRGADRAAFHRIHQQLRRLMAANSFAPFWWAIHCQGGGSPNPTNPGVNALPKPRTPANWYNPCAFAIRQMAASSPTTRLRPSRAAARSGPLRFWVGRRNQAFGPGYNRIDMAIFKTFPILREPVAAVPRRHVQSAQHAVIMEQPNGSITGRMAARSQARAHCAPNAPMRDSSNWHEVHTFKAYHCGKPPPQPLFGCRSGSF